eukprot:m.51540 g.51540  ORF g.51540 m.51540 type:complete len:109 (+) comp7567_c2_seq1:175-501(+)
MYFRVICHLHTTLPLPMLLPKNIVWGVISFSSNLFSRLGSIFFVIVVLRFFNPFSSRPSVVHHLHLHLLYHLHLLLPSLLVDVLFYCPFYFFIHPPSRHPILLSLLAF